MFSCTRDDRKERIVAAGNSVRQALQELLSEYMDNAGKKQSEQLDDAIQNMLNKTRGLRKQLRKAVVDHVSDSFLEPDNPLLLLMTAAKEGREKEVEEFGGMFTEHARKLIEVANLACSMSNNEDGVKMVRYAASQIENLCPQVRKCTSQIVCGIVRRKHKRMKGKAFRTRSGAAFLRKYTERLYTMIHSLNAHLL